MRKNLLTHICALCALSFIPSSVMAEVLFSESFDGLEEGRLSKGAWSSGTILSDGWYTNGGPSTFRQVAADAQLTYSGYCSATSGKAITTSGNNQKDYILFATGKQKTSLSAGQKYYMSFLFNATALNTSDNAKTGAASYAYIAGLLTSASNTGIAYTQGIVQVKTKSDNSKFYFGIRKKNESTVYGTTEFSLNQTYLVVVEYNVVDGTQNDVVNLYINPDKENPAAEVSTSSQTYASSYADATAFVGVGLLSGAQSPTGTVTDELKVATSWDDLWEAGGDTPEPEPEPDPIPVPSPVASSITVNSATISWDEVENADSYVLQWKKNGTSYGEEIAINKDVRSYDLSNLVENTKYYVQVKTVIGANSSDFAEIDFTTTAEPAFITYQGTTFTKYDVTNDLPSVGERFIARNIVFSTDVNITGDLKLCLNGYSIFTYTHRIIVKNGATLTIYNNKGDGQILGGVVASSWLDLGGVIKVEDGGTLIIREGAIENIADDEDGSYAVNNLGTLVISGAPSLIGNSASIYLTSGKMITLEEGKPLTNTTPYSVNSPGQLFTSGWSACMGDATPSTYFSSAKSGFSKVLAGKNELYLVHSGTLSLSENNDNASIIGGVVGGSTDDILMDRVFTDTQYNTICLPFALTNGQLEQIFGSGYDLQEFSYSALDGDVLNLHFNARTDLEAGKPYLIWPTQEVEDILRNGADITAAEPVDQTSDPNISFHGVYSPTELEGGNKNLLFLGAENELFYPASTANIKGFRAYFELKGAAQKAAKRARIVKKEDSATGIDQITNDKSPMTNKIIKDGQLLILRDNKTYNVIGQMVK